MVRVRAAGTSSEVKVVMTRDKIEATLKELLIRALRIEDMTPDQLSADQRLLEGEIAIDSIDILQLILEIENAFGIKLVKGEFARGEWETIKTLVAAIEARMQAQA
jgi:acyl carrier protein